MFFPFSFDGGKKIERNSLACYYYMLRTACCCRWLYNNQGQQTDRQTDGKKRKKINLYVFTSVPHVEQFFLFSYFFFFFFIIGLSWRPTPPGPVHPPQYIYFFLFFLPPPFGMAVKRVRTSPHPQPSCILFARPPARSVGERYKHGRTDGRTMNVTDSLPQLVCGEEYQSIEGKKRGSVQSGKHSTPDNNKKTKPKNNNSRNKSGLISSLIVTFGNKKTNFWFSFFLGQTNK